MGNFFYKKIKVYQYLFYIIILFALSLITLFVLTFIFYKRLSSLADYSNAVDHSNKVIYHFQTLQSYLRDEETGQRGYLLTGDSSFLEPLFGGHSKVNPELDSIKMLTGNDSMQQQYIGMLQQYIDQLENLYSRTSLDNISNHRQLALTLNEGKRIMDSCRAISRKVQNEELRILNIRRNSREFYANLLPGSLKIIFATIGAIATLFFILLILEVVKRISYQKKLQQNIAGLNVSKSELEQITYAISHDLQEPVRKIITLNDRLAITHKNILQEEGKMILQKIDKAGKRMQLLIGDLVTFTTLVQNAEPLTEVDLNEIVNIAWTDCSEQAIEKQAIFKKDNLPVVKGYARQLHILFYSILDNALKFSRKDVAPVITITYHVSEEESSDQKFHKITIADNGIGFENEYVEKLFKMFQRLHNQVSEYEGKGIGLPVAKRIMTNHGGFITASGQPDKGASFSLYFKLAE